MDNTTIELNLFVNDTMPISKSLLEDETFKLAAKVLEREFHLINIVNEDARQILIRGGITELPILRVDINDQRMTMKGKYDIIIMMSNCAKNKMTSALNSSAISVESYKNEIGKRKKHQTYITKDIKKVSETNSIKNQLYFIQPNKMNIGVVVDYNAFIIFGDIDVSIVTVLKQDFPHTTVFITKSRDLSPLFKLLSNLKKDDKVLILSVLESDVHVVSALASVMDQTVDLKHIKTNLNSADFAAIKSLF